MGKINIADLLRDCPQGMELDCTMFDYTTLHSVSIENDYPIKIISKNGCTSRLTKYGQYVNSEDAKCVIFPRGKNTWEGFVPPCTFKDGDIIASLNSSIYIFTNCSSTVYGYFFAPCGLIADRNSENHHFKVGPISISIDNMRLATEDEKAMLFRAIKDNGYRWNPETKTLEKLPKFKVGDRIKKDKDYISGIITNISDDGFYKVEYQGARGGGVSYINIACQDEWQLDQSKFDINTLVPYESRVLMRSSNAREWVATFYSHYNNNKFYGCGMCCDQCIPYEGNEHLRGTSDDCDPYFRTWEE